MASSARSQEPLVTDRPDVAESAVTVGAGRVQLETGLSLTKEDGAYTTTFPTLVRIGLGDRWELRVESDMFELQNPGLNGLSDVALGAKVNFIENDSTNLGLLVDVSVPVGHPELRGTDEAGRRS
jgi:hypothetical protein